MALNVCNWLWRVLIAASFLVAAYAKFQAGISYMPPETIYDRIVAFSPWRHYTILGMEAFVGVWVLSGVKTRWASVATGVLLVAFCGLILAELASENPFNCGCGIRPVFPEGDPRSNLTASLVRNILLLLGVVWLYLVGERGPKADEDAGRQGDVGDRNISGA